MLTPDSLLLLAQPDSLSLPLILLSGLGLIVGLFFMAFALMFAPVFPLWIRAMTSGAAIGPLQMVVMKLKKVNPTVVVDARIIAVQAGLTDISSNAMESHYLAGGNLPIVIRALVASQKANIRTRLEYRSRN